MTLNSSIQILTAWCAVSKEAEQTIFPGLAQYMQEQPDAIPQWEQLLKQLGDSAARLRRYWHINRGVKRPSITLTDLTFSDSHVLWQGKQIGRVQTFYKATLPYEAQARIAYDVFFDRFTTWLMQRHTIIPLHETAYHLKLFFPASAVDEDEMDSLWEAFVSHMFSGPALQQSFVNLVNSIKLTERGFSALSVPIITEDHAIYLAAFYLANVMSLQRGDRKRQNEIAQLRDKLTTAEGKDVVRIKKNITKLEKELAIRQERYQPFYDQVEALKTQYPHKMGRVTEIASKQFRGRAGTQIAKAGAKIGKCLQDMAGMLALATDDYYKLPPLVTTQPISDHVRPGGDSHTKLCYACGRTLQRGEPVYSANKFIFESPSQRLQSSAGQTQPKICGSCAAISFVSPIKLGSGRLVVRMRQQNDLFNRRAPIQPAPYRADEQLRMFTMDDIGVIAGKYVILSASEMVGNNLVFDQLGGEQYALYKVGISFKPQVFRLFEIEAVISDADVPLNGRHLTVMHYLSNIFNLNRGRWHDKGQFAAFGRAIRQVQQDNLVFAIYELATSGILLIGNGWGREQARILEDLRKEHVEWLEMNKPNLAQEYKDIAAMTALLYAFLSEMDKKLHGDKNKQRIEIRKVIDRAEEPEQVAYTIAPYVGGEDNRVTVFLRRHADTYFSFDQLAALLSELPSTFDRWEGKDSIRLTLDDLYNAYAYLYDSRYATDKDKREFAYKLKLSLAARFPQYYEKKESNKE